MILSELFKKANIVTPYGTDIEVSGLACDSRKVKKGDLFIALQGTKDNGEKFIPDAVRAGAVAVLCEHAVPADVPVFDTPNVRKAASEIAVAFYNAHPETLLGVTGTNGKTSTVFFVREILKALGKNAASIGTLGVQSDK